MVFVTCTFKGLPDVCDTHLPSLVLKLCLCLVADRSKDQNDQCLHWSHVAMCMYMGILQSCVYMQLHAQLWFSNAALLRPVTDTLHLALFHSGLLWPSEMFFSSIVHMIFSLWKNRVMWLYIYIDICVKFLWPFGKSIFRINQRTSANSDVLQQLNACTPTNSCTYSWMYSTKDIDEAVVITFRWILD